MRQHKLRQSPLKILLAILLAAPCLITHATIYKWTDNDGVTHFTDREPTIESQVFTIKREPAKFQVDEAKKIAEKNIALSKSLELRKENSKLLKEKTVPMQKVTKYCNQYKSNIASLSKGKSRYVSVDGSIKKLNEFERVSRINLLQATISNYC